MIYDGSYKSLLGGVSQQIPRERLSGQLGSQENMLSDPVTGLRRRQGLQVRGTISNFYGNKDNTLTQYVEIGSSGFNILINSTTGEVVVLDKEYNVTDRQQNDYLIASDISKLKETTSSGYGWIVNTEKIVGLGSPDSTKLNPIHDGYFFIRTGAFLKNYNINIVNGSNTWDFTYTTPEGTDTSQVLVSTPEGVATQLQALMVANSTFNAIYNTYRDGAYVYFTKRTKTPTNLDSTVVTSSSGQTYTQVSGSHNVSQESDLPAKLNVMADGMIISVGLSTSSRSYYFWDASEASWQECGDYESAVTLTNMPLRYVVYEDGTIELDNTEFEGRVSGDDVNNPYPHFIDHNLTGISSFQGRLVLLAGAYIALSGSNQPLRFMRSTVSTVRADDPIETGSGSATAASFEYAVQFNKDLILIASAHQAVLPTQNTVLTPENSFVVLTSKQNIDTRSNPQVVGKTLMYGSPVSEDYFGVGELNPSVYTNSQYSPQNLTDHIPRYMTGRCRQIVSSNTANMAFFSSTVDTKGLLVHEYLWNGEERPLMSWHHWSFPLDLCSMHFARDIVVVALDTGEDTLICTLDPRVSAFLSTGWSRPFLDLYSYVEVIDNKFTLPAHLQNLALVDSIRLAQILGDLSGEPIGIKSINTSTWEVTTVRSYPDGMAAVGVKFESAFEPTPPMMRDKNDVVITTLHSTVLNYRISVQNSGEFYVTVNGTEEVLGGAETTGLTWSSIELGLNKPKVAQYGTVVVPCRSLAHTTEVLVSTDGTRDLNVIDIEYSLRAVQKRRRL